ncbi:hypothetical protein IV102_08045 [bacterium]|nr:hypothetical protein [bacterium]
MRLRRRGLAIIAVLLMLVILSAVVGAMVLAGTGNLNGQSLYTQDEEARAAADAGMQMALGNITVAPNFHTWNVPAAWAIPAWQTLPQGHGQFRAQIFDGGGVQLFVTPGNPALNVAAAISAIQTADAIARVPVDVGPNKSRFLLVTGRSSSGKFQQVGMWLVGPPPGPFRIVARQSF